MKQDELLNWYLMSTTLMCDTVSRAYFVIFVFDICELAYYPPCTTWASKELFDGAMLSRHVTSHRSFPSSMTSCTTTTVHSWNCWDFLIMHVKPELLAFSPFIRSSGRNPAVPIVEISLRKNFVKIINLTIKKSILSNTL